MSGEVDPMLLEGYHRLADVIVSGSHGMPAASTADPNGKWVQRGSSGATRSGRLGASAHRVGTGVQPNDFINELYHDDREAFEQLYTFVISTYYMSPKIMKAIRYPGQKRNVPFSDEADVYLEDGILEPVLERGLLYRAPPSARGGISP